MFFWDRLRDFTWAISQQDFLAQTGPKSPVSTQRPEDEANALHAVHYYERWHDSSTVRGAVGMQCVCADGLTPFLSWMACPQQGNQAGNVLCNNSFTLCHDWGVQKGSLHGLRLSKGAHSNMGEPLLYRFGYCCTRAKREGICWSTLLLLRRGWGGFSSLYLFVLLKGKQNNYLYTETWWLSISMSCWSCHPKAWWQPVCRSSLCSKYPNLWVQLSPLGNVPRKAFPCTFPRASAFKFATFLLHLAVLFAWTGLVARSSGLTGPSCQSVCSSDEVVGKCSLSSSRFGSGTLIRLGLSYLTPGAVPPP